MCNVAVRCVLTSLLVPLSLSSCTAQVSVPPSVTRTPKETGISVAREGKRSWTEIRVPSGGSGDAIAFADGGRVALTGASTLLLSSDGGRSWQPIGAAAGGDHLYSTNGGETFLPAGRLTDSLTVKDLCSVEGASFAHRGRLYLRAGCDHSTQLWSVNTAASDSWHIRSFTRDEGESDEGVYTPGINLVPAGTRILIDAILPQGIALLTTDDEGNTWFPLWTDPHAEAGIVGFDFINEDGGWMLLGDGAFLQSRDGGRTWKKIANLPAEPAKQTTSLDFVTDKIGFIVGNGGLILMTRDGGQNWQQQTSGVGENLYKVAAADTNHVWASGQSGVLLETRDGGASWCKVELGIKSDIRSLSVNNKQLWFVVNNRIYISP